MKKIALVLLGIILAFNILGSFNVINAGVWANKNNMRLYSVHYQVAHRGVASTHNEIITD